MSETKLVIHGFRPPGSREDDLLEIAWASLPASQRKPSGFYVDVSQSADRRPWGTLRCITARSLIIDFARRRDLNGKHLFALQGHPSEAVLDGLSVSQQTKLVGQGMFIPSIASILLSIFVQSHAPWVNRRPQGRKRALGS